MGLLTTMPSGLQFAVPSTLAVANLSISAVRNAAVLAAVYLATLVVYRLYFHPLAKHPGPFWAKITDWNTVYHAYRGDRHLELYHAHQKYGPIVRVAPNMLSFNTASGLKSIYGHTPTARCIQKGQFYTAFPAVKGVHNTHNSISKVEHGRKRRVLSAAFSENALKSMEGLVLNCVDTFMDGVKKGVEEGRSLNMGDMFSWLTFDVMGELCFGKTFGMLTDQSQRFVTDLISKASHNHYISGNYLPLRNLGLTRLLFPTIAKDRWRFIEHSRACANERMKLDHSAKKDFFYYLLHAEDPETGEKFSTKELWGEANVIMIAGSDTTATALSATLFYLCRNPATLEKLKQEVRSKFDSMDEIVTGKALGECHYLKACVDEAMRLSPPVPGLLPREVIEPAGCTIDGIHVPCGTVIGTPIYTIHHNPLYYSDPFAYKPERWLSQDEEEAENVRAAFTPFSIGTRGCIGKSVAYMELRLAIARLVWGYEMRQRSMEGVAEKWREGFAIQEGEYRLADHFTSAKSGPVVDFEKRVM